MQVPTALVLHPDCARHDTGWGHPEHQGRLPAVINAVYQDTPALLDVMMQREAQPAELADLRRVHSEEMIELVRAAAVQAEQLERLVALDEDTIVSPASWDAALAAAGCVIEAARIVTSGEAQTAFAASRPPGHHATPTRSMGFCLFNNIAVAARYAQANLAIARPLIIDWDVHHGNGTQDIFYDDGTVFYLSTHLSPHYPGTGHVHERGHGAGEGTTLNVPLPHGTDAVAYERAFARALDSALSVFTPDIVFMSAGFDCLANDPLGGMLLEPRDLHATTLRIMREAKVGVVAALEGGYVPKRVGEGVVDVLRAFAGLPGGRVSVSLH
jgi:acetoin utilization deacetylase AcuC-like enzyme